MTSAVDVGYDVTATIAGRTGVARYARELVAAVGRYDVRPHLVTIGRGPYDPPAGTRHVGVPRRVVAASWRVTGRPRFESLAGAVDVVHALDGAAPPTRRAVVVTVHDLAALEHPELHTNGQVAQQREQLDALDRAAAICAVSTATADALQRAGVDRDRITVTPLGHTPLTAPEPTGIDPPFLLAVGEVAARKGLGTLVDAFLAADLPPAWRLVIAGPAGYRADEVLMRTGERIIAIGAVTDGVLSGLYASAAALCFPSLAEGFGLPVLEAMAAGLPVLASDLDAVREVTDGAAVLLPPGDVEAWREAIAGVDAGLPDLTDAGRRRAAAYTWDGTAAATAAVYRRVLACG